MKSAVVLAVLIAAVAAFSRGEGSARPAYPMPGTFATLQVADALGTVTGGAGDAWVDDRWDERLLRIDHRTGDVSARIPVRGRLAVAAGAGSIWALQSGGSYGRGLRGPLLRIDPATSRVTDRIRLEALGFGIVIDGNTVWVWGPDRLMWIAEGRVYATIRVDDEQLGETTGLALVGNDAVITTADGHLVRFDLNTGEEIDSVRLPFTAPSLQFADADRLILVAGGEVAAVEPETGAVLWRTRLGYRVGSVSEAGGVLWTYGASIRDPGDRVWKLDPARGTALGSVLLPAFGTMGMAVIDGTLWVTIANGSVLVLRR